MGLYKETNAFALYLASVCTCTCVYDMMKYIVHVQCTHVHVVYYYETHLDTGNTVFKSSLSTA